MKLPFMQFFPNDWRSEPSISLLSLSARGLWFELLLCMHMADRCGVISGTREELAQLGRCSAVEVSKAIDEFKLRNTCEVTERNKVVTLLNRRMKREWEARQKGLERVRRYRQANAVTPSDTRKSHMVMVSGNGISSGNGRESEGNPTLAEVLTFCGMGSGIPEPCGTAFWNAMEGCGWIDRAKRPVLNWRPILQNFAATWRANEHRDSLIRNGHSKAQPSSTTSALPKIKAPLLKLPHQQ